MSSLSIICFIILFFLILTLFRRESDLFSPGRLLLIVWSLAIGLADLKLSRYQKQWNDYSWFMLVLALASFLIGMFIIYVINLGKPTKSVLKIREIIKIDSVNTDILYRYTVYLFMAYLISFVVSTLVIGFVPIFTKNPALARNDWGIFGFGLFVQSFPAIIYLAILYFILCKGNRNKKIKMFSIVVITFFTYALLLQRYYILFAIMLVFITLYYSTSAFRPRNVTIALILIFAIFFGMSYIRLSQVAVNLLYYLSNMKYSVKYAAFTEPYMYVVMNLENFAHAVSKTENFTYGLFTFDFIFALSGLKHSMVEYLTLPTFPHLITNNYNTYTMFFVYYWDFGIVGLGFIPLILGMIFSSVYYWMRREPNIINISIYGIFAFVLLFSFFIPIITFLHFAFNFFVILIITTMISTAHSKK